jgi:hypothetical protein
MQEYGSPPADIMGKLPPGFVSLCLYFYPLLLLLSTISFLILPFPLAFPSVLHSLRIYTLRPSFISCPIFVFLFLPGWEKALSARAEF